MNRLILLLVFALFSATVCSADADLPKAPANDAFPEKPGDNQVLYKLLDQLNCYPPEYASAMRTFISKSEELNGLKKLNDQINSKIPDLTTAKATLEQKKAQLDQQLTTLINLPDSRFTAMKALCDNPGAHLSDKLIAAHAYVWAYPKGTHTPDVQKLLADLQNKQAENDLAMENQEAARQQHLRMLEEGAKSRSLDLSQWREYLNNKSQPEVMEVLGTPTRTSGDYWYYVGPWVFDPNLQLKVGIVLNFNGNRVTTVSPNPIQ